jgi:tRNA/tmRNA/rRNA uracil-C5-methylase (TrmA/RlmC/RlmD family)
MAESLAGGEEVLLDVESVALSGEGVARLEGLVYFVEGALRGETVRARILKRERNLIRAVAQEIVAASTDRVKPACPHFGVCGGCVFQHMSYERQLAEKTEALRGTFRFLGGFDNLAITPVIPSPKPFGYRNTIALSVRHREGKPHFGFIGRDRKSFVPIEHCPIAEETLNAWLPEVKAKFLARVPERKRFHTSQIVVRIGEEGSRYASIKEKPEPELWATVMGKRLRYSGASFFQVNFSLLPKLVETISEMLSPSDGRVLLDVCCGVGLFAVCLGDRYDEVIGIEDSHQAIGYASENAKSGGLAHGRWIEGRAETVLTEFAKPCGKKRHVILDPPREGFKPQALRAVLDMPEVERMVYVSCNPATLVRDLKQLGERFDIARVQPFDMFPQTAHLEAVVLLTPPGENGPRTYKQRCVRVS